MTNSLSSIYHNDENGHGDAQADLQAAQQDALFVGSVEKALRVLQAFRGDKSALSLTDIIERTGLGKSAAQRFCHTLVALGYLERNPQTRQLKPAAKLLEFSFSFLASNALSSYAAPFLLAAREESGEAVNLALPHGCDVIYVTRLASSNSLMINPPIGGRAPMFCTSSGRAYLSALPLDEAAEIIDKSNLSPITEHTNTDRDTILQLIEQARRDGYASAIQECIIGELTVGAPILDKTGRVVAAMNICVHGRAWSETEMKEKFAPIVMKTANNITQALATAPDF